MPFIIIITYGYYYGYGYYWLRFVSGRTKNAKESDPGHLEHLFYILCGNFDEKKNGGIP